MKARNFRNLYRKTFWALGHRLTARDGMPAGRIAAAEKKLGLRLPAALRDYYLVAGRERSLNHAFNHLRAPGGWEKHASKLIFLEEQQCVVVWGVTVAASSPADDPAVFQGPMVDDEPSGWYLEQRRCSAFLVFMLHLQAAYGGGMRFTGAAAAAKSLIKALDRNWYFAGEVNGMRAYSRPGQVVCIAPWPDLLGGGKSWRVFAGACAEEGLEAIANELGLAWD
jgi:hypothetical protein